MVSLTERDVGFAWVYAIIFAFLLGISHMLIFPVLNSKVAPAMISASTLPAAEKAQYSSQVYQIIFYLRITTYIFFMSVIIYMFLSIFKREQQDYYV